MSNTSSKTRYMVELAMMIAVILLMAFTPLGYIRTPFLTVTLITIPVAVGAMFLGPKGGMVCGLAFGLTSFYTALTAPSLMMAAFMTVNPIYVAILCIIPRALEGLFCGLIFKALRKASKNPVTYYIAGILFMGTLVLLFYNCEYVVNMRETLGVSNPLAFVVAVVGVQALFEVAACGIVSGALGQGLNRVLKR